MYIPNDGLFIVIKNKNGIAIDITRFPINYKTDNFSSSNI